jgi:predicted ATP-binding protein involved in virulence
MRIKKIKIENYRCFEQKELSFDPHFNVVIGENGLGKTTILEALVGALKMYVANFVKEKQPHLRKNYIKNEDIRRIKQGSAETIGKEETSLTLYIENFFGEDTNRYDFDWKVNAKNKFGDAETLNVKRKMNAILYSKEKNAALNVKLPIIAYYPTDRITPTTSQIAPHVVNPNDLRTIAYDNALENQKVLMTTITARIKTLEFEEWKLSKEAPTNSLLASQLHLVQMELNALKKPIINCIPDCVKVDFSSTEHELMIDFENGDRKPFSILSEGFRNTLAIVADIAYRCARLNSHLEENILTETEGIVLIDDLDLHLHPNWQRRIVPDLKRTFPKIQFIVSTHSPFIVQSLKKEELINLGNEEETEKEPFQKSIEDVVSDEMGVEVPQRSVLFMQMEKNAMDFFNLVKKGVKGKDLAEAKQKLDELTLLYSDDAAYTALLKSELPRSI